MFNNTIFKRIVPFVIALGVGLFIASFFVSLAPTFKFKKNKCGKRPEMRNLRYENDRLRRENQRLQQKLNETETMILLEAPVPPQVKEFPADSIPTAPRAK